jgi:hypothetical protein
LQVLWLLSNAVLNRCAQFGGRKTTTKGESYEEAITINSNIGVGGHFAHDGQCRNEFGRNK